MPIYELDGQAPDLPEAGRFWVAPDAHVIGRDRLGADVGIWFGAVLRGDGEPLEVGGRTNIQEGAMLHAAPDRGDHRAPEPEGGGAVHPRRGPAAARGGRRSA